MSLLVYFIVFFVSVTANDYTGLLDPKWQDIISVGGMHIGSGRAKRLVEINSYQDDVAHQACILPDGKTGHCRHLRHCIQEAFKTDFLKFMEYICIIDQTSLGACCPDDWTRGSAEGLAGDLPATALSDERSDIVMKIGRAENRGCGLSTRQQGRVTGAQRANPREWPWMAAVSPVQCGGVVITDQHVLTAAHCTERYKPLELSVRLGEYDFSRSNDSRSYNFRVVDIRQHELYTNWNFRNDIAILKLHRAATFNTYVWPICLPPPDMPLTDKNAYMIGWGTQSFGGPRSNVLLEVLLPIWDHEKCISNFADTVFDESICAGGRDGKDACQGDSGGPLMYQMASGRWTVIGVVSWGVRCGEPNHPGIYTRVDKYLSWIAQNARF